MEKATHHTLRVDQLSGRFRSKRDLYEYLTVHCKICLNKVYNSRGILTELWED